LASIKEKISFLQGLTQGLDVDRSSKEGKVLTGIISVLEDMADQIEDIEIAQDELADYLESIDEDICDLEDGVFGDEEFPDEDFVEVVCPKCQEIVCFETDIVDDEDLIEVTCPNCDEVVYVNDQDILEGIEDNKRMPLASGVDEDI